jgi:predicted lipoprotein with Yx(FWY)xxD motif
MRPPPIGRIVAFRASAFDERSHMPRRASTVLALSTAAIIAVSVAGCGGGSSSAPPTTPDGSPATLGIGDHALGKMLVDAKGRTLYLFGRDTSTRSTCTGACLTYWIPLVAKGKPRVGTGADSALAGTARQADGRSQVIYNGHLLYRYVGDTQAGDVNGQNVNTYGGTWEAVAPSGAAITSPAPQGGSGY